MKPLTRKRLIDAIRRATDLNELQRFVGPSEEEIERAACVNRNIADIWERHGLDMTRWSLNVRERYDRFTAEQTRFENKYL